MIRGSITADWEASVPLLVRGPSGQEQSLDTLIDTGFDGFLTLPPALVAALTLIYHGQILVTLGDGSHAALRQFEAVVDWDGQARDVLVLEADGGTLIGMSLLYGSRLTLDIVDGGPVIIEPLPAGA